MNLKTFLSFLLVFTLLSFAGYAQEEEEPEYMYGTRSLGATMFQHDFGTVNAVTEYKFEVKNEGMSKLFIKGFYMPAGISVTVLNRKIKPKSVGYFVVKIDPALLKKAGPMQKHLILITETKLPSGVRITKETDYLLKANIQK